MKNNVDLNNVIDNSMLIPMLEELLIDMSHGINKEKLVEYKDSIKKIYQTFLNNLGAEDKATIISHLSNFDEVLNDEETNHTKLEEKRSFLSYCLIFLRAFTNRGNEVVAGISNEFNSDKFKKNTYTIEGVINECSKAFKSSSKHFKVNLPVTAIIELNRDELQSLVDKILDVTKYYLDSDIIITYKNGIIYINESKINLLNMGLTFVDMNTEEKVNKVLITKKNLLPKSLLDKLDELGIKLPNNFEKELSNIAHDNKLIHKQWPKVMSGIYTSVLSVNGLSMGQTHFLFDYIVDLYLNKQIEEKIKVILGKIFFKGLPRSELNNVAVGILNISNDYKSKTSDYFHKNILDTFWQKFEIDKETRYLSLGQINYIKDIITVYLDEIRKKITQLYKKNNYGEVPKNLMLDIINSYGSYSNSKNYATIHIGESKIVTEIDKIGLNNYLDEHQIDALTQHILESINKKQNFAQKLNKGLSSIFSNIKRNINPVILSTSIALFSGIGIYNKIFKVDNEGISNDITATTTDEKEESFKSKIQATKPEQDIWNTINTTKKNVELNSTQEIFTLPESQIINPIILPFTSNDTLEPEKDQITQSPIILKESPIFVEENKTTEVIETQKPKNTEGVINKIPVTNVVESNEKQSNLVQVKTDKSSTTTRFMELFLNGAKGNQLKNDVMYGNILNEISKGDGPYSVYKKVKDKYKFTTWKWLEAETYIKGLLSSNNSGFSNLYPNHLTSNQIALLIYSYHNHKLTSLDKAKLGINEILIRNGILGNNLDEKLQNDLHIITQNIKHGSGILDAFRVVKDYYQLKDVPEYMLAHYGETELKRLGLGDKWPLKLSKDMLAVLSIGYMKSFTELNNTIITKKNTKREKTIIFSLWQNGITEKDTNIISTLSDKIPHGTGLIDTAKIAGIYDNDSKKTSQKFETDLMTYAKEVMGKLSIFDGAEVENGVFFTKLSKSMLSNIITKYSNTKGLKVNFENNNQIKSSNIKLADLGYKIGDSVNYTSYSSQKTSVYKVIAYDGNCVSLKGGGKNGNLVFKVKLDNFIANVS